MKNLFLWAVLATALLALAGCGSGDSDCDCDDNANADSPAALVSESDTDIVLNVTVGDVTVEPVQTKGGEFLAVEIDGFDHAGAIGEPALPALRRIVRLPAGATVSVTADPAMVERLAVDGLVVPNQPPLEKLPGAEARAPFAFNPDAYADDAFLVGRWADVVEDGMVRNHRLGLLEITPVDYNPATGELLVAHDLVVTIHLDHADDALEAELAATHGSEIFDALVTAQVINKGSKYLPFRQPAAGAEYLIIYADTFASSTALAQFVANKRAAGYDVSTRAISQIGNNVVAIRNYIISQYNALPDLTFVLLVGDTNTIANATGFATDNPPTDLFYSCMTAADYFPDVLLGRFPVRTETELANLVGKIAAYEAASKDKDWLHNAVFMASSDRYYITEATHNTVIQYFLQPHGFTSTKLYSQTYSATTAQVTAAFNAGVNFGIYSGHGDTTVWADGPYYTQANVRALTNTVYPFVGSFACLTGSYQLDECFAETWVRDDRAASGIVASSVTSYWDEDDWFEKGFFLSLYNFPNSSLPEQIWVGGAVLAGKMAVWMKSNNGGGSSQRYYEMYNLFGDPSMELFNF